MTDPTYSQSAGLVVRVADGYPVEVPADGQSTTTLELNLDNCAFGVPVDPTGNFTFFSTTSMGTIDPPFLTLTMESGDFPPLLVLKSGDQTGEAQVEVIVSICPSDAIAIMGVCTDQAYLDASCSGSTFINFVTPDSATQDTSQTNPPAEQPSLPSSPDDRQDQAQADQQNPEMSLTELYQDLEEFLAGEDITAPTPGQMAASGIALTTLLAGWLVLNQMSGVSAEQSLDVIKAWRDGERPPIGTEAELLTGVWDGGIEGNLPDDDPETTDEEIRPPAEHTPIQEAGEDRLLRTVNDSQDMDDALKKTNKDIETFEGKIPDHIKNSEAWKKHVAPKLKQVKDLFKKGELDKGRTWLDRAEELLKLRDQVDRDLDYLPPDKREAILWTERTLKVLGHFAADTYQTIVVAPAKAAGENILPGEYSKNFGKAMDEFSQSISDLGQGLAKMPRETIDNLTHANLRKIAPEEHKELYREWKTEQTDFIGKGIKKWRELYNHTMRCIFHDR
jgi:hypothetical protein